MKKTLGTIVTIMVVAILIGTFITVKYATAGESGRDGHFIAYDNGTVLDMRTNLMWAAWDSGRLISWEAGQSYCENYRGGGYTDWRMPTPDELATLYDAGKSRTAACGSGDVHVATGLISISCFWVSASGPATFNFHELNVSNAERAPGQGYWKPDIGYTGVALPVRSVK